MSCLRLVCALALLATGTLALGCNNDADSAREGSQPSEPIEKEIAADEGGKVATAGAQVKIPGGALDEDTTITIAPVERDSLENVENVASNVFDFGPDGTTFSEPVTISIDFDAARTPKGMSAKLAFLDGDEWHALDDSEVDGNEVTGTTTHFTPYAVIFVAKQTAGDSCDESAFKACGGDLIGTWEFTLGCLTLPDDLLGAGEDAFALCNRASVSASIDLQGTISFGEDGSYMIDQKVDTTITKYLPKECLTEDMTCDDLAADGAGEASDADDHCELEQGGSSENSDSGTYEVDGDTFTTTSDGTDTASEPIEYCVDEERDTITARVNVSAGQVMVFKATRK
jgi:hypothetical protein